MKADANSEKNNQEQRHNEEAERRGYEEIVELAKGGNPVAIEALGRGAIAGKLYDAISTRSVIELLKQALAASHAPALSILASFADENARTACNDDVLFVINKDLFQQYSELASSDSTAWSHLALLAYVKGDYEGGRRCLDLADNKSLESRMTFLAFVLATRRCENEIKALIDRVHEVESCLSKEIQLAIERESECIRLRATIASQASKLRDAERELKNLKAEVSRLQPSVLNEYNAKLLSRDASLKSQFATERELLAEAIAAKDKKLCQLKSDLTALEMDIPRRVDQASRDLIAENAAATRRQIKAERDAEHVRRECERYKALCRRHGLSLYAQPQLAEAGGQ